MRWWWTVMVGIREQDGAMHWIWWRAMTWRWQRVIPSILVGSKTNKNTLMKEVEEDIKRKAFFCLKWGFCWWCIIIITIIILRIFLVKAKCSLLFVFCLPRRKEKREDESRTYKNRNSLFYYVTYFFDMSSNVSWRGSWDPVILKYIHNVIYIPTFSTNFFLANWNT